MFRKRHSIHIHFLKTLSNLILCIFLFFLPSACNQGEPNSESLNVTITSDGTAQEINASLGMTVQNALSLANITLNNLDRVEPPQGTLLTKGLQIAVIRVHEDFEYEETSISFEHQTVRNETLPEGQTLLIQSGINGVQKITYRTLYENDVEVSRNILKTETIQEAQPEIIMIGIQTPFVTFPISGKLVFLTTGNAWLMEASSSNRTPIITTGDLDGRVFSLSPDSNWLLYTRKPDTGSTDKINTLWVVNLLENPLRPISLRIDNVVSFADWVPGMPMTITYSTAEFRSTAPGWQANNDLELLTFDSTGMYLRKEEIIEANAGGIYGWWGTDFAWSPDGSMLAYARPDQVGLVDLDRHELIPYLNLIPLQTQGDWAWVPGITWSPDMSTLYTVTHQPQEGYPNNETSPLFDISAIVIAYNGNTIDMVNQSGVFSYPVSSPFFNDGNYQITYLQAVFPDQSYNSHYRLTIMDRDGSNKMVLFPPEGSTGIEPQKILWQPGTQSGEDPLVALIYDGNLWLVNTVTGASNQITGDGSITRMDWK
jgi:resuscitation-promoting factor RpfB